MKCNNCGKTIGEDARFCKYCGNLLVADETSSIENETIENRIELTDEDGNQIYFEFLDLITYHGKDYIVLLPEDDADEVIILQVESLSDESENYVTVENQQILETVFEIFKERNRDFFTFTD